MTTFIQELLALIALLIGFAHDGLPEPEAHQLSVPPAEVSAPILPPVTLADLLSDTSWPESEWSTVDAIAFCESRYIPSAVGDDGLALGLMQIRVDYHPRKADRYDLLDPTQNLEAAHQVWIEAGRSYWPWSCWR